MADAVAGGRSCPPPYFTALTEVASVMATLDKYPGDGILAFFAIPSRRRSRRGAVAAAFGTTESWIASAAVDAELHEDDRRLGITRATDGRNIGAEDRIDTPSSHHVNVASRLAGIALQCQIC